MVNNWGRTRTVVGQPQGYLDNDQEVFYEEGYPDHPVVHYGADKGYQDSQSERSEEPDSDASGVGAKGRKRKQGMGCYGCLKILNCLIYLGTLCLAFAYFSTTKFVSKFTYYIYFGVLVARPSLIGLYSLVMVILEQLR